MRGILIALLLAVLAATGCQSLRDETSSDGSWKMPGIIKADIVTMRAVRPDAALCEAVRALLASSGRFFWLTSVRAAESALPGFSVQSLETLIPGSTTALVVMV